MASPPTPCANPPVLTKVAVVEDNETLRQYLAELISKTAGYSCICTCSSAEEAKVKLPECPPHVVLMDIHLPGESGIACTAFLRDKMPRFRLSCSRFTKILT